MDNVCNRIIYIIVPGKWWGKIVIKKKKDRQTEGKKERKDANKVGEIKC